MVMNTLKNLIRRKSDRGCNCPCRVGPTIGARIVTNHYRKGIAMPTPTPPELDAQIWNLMIDAERLNRYFYEKADKYRHVSKYMNLCLFVATVGSAAYVVMNISNLASVWSIAAGTVVFVITAALTGVEMFFQVSKNLGIAEGTTKQCQLISTEARQLWRRLRDPSSNVELLVRANDLEMRLNIATQVELDYDSDLNEKCEKEAIQILTAEFPSA